jgi:hypothetical protein
MLYKAMIRSVTTYACPTWEYAAHAHLLKLQRLQNRVLVLKLQCNKCSTYTERPDSSFVKEEGLFRNTYMSRKEHKSKSQISRRLKPGIIVLAKASRNLTDQLIGPQLPHGYEFEYLHCSSASCRM